MTPAPVATRGWTGGLSAAIGFLTILPVREARAAEGRGTVTVFFPWVGALLGLTAAGAVRVPDDAQLGAVLALALLFVLTGGLHWDGWADVLDAAVPPGLTVGRRIGILRDPRIGAHAAVGVGLLLLLAVWGLARAPLWGVVLGSALGRWTMVATLRWGPPLRPDGTGAGMRGAARPVLAAAGVVVPAGAAVALGVDAVRLLAVAASGLAIAGLSAVVLLRRFGGLNGDGHGAVGLLTEVATWATAAELAGAGS